MWVTVYYRDLRGGNTGLAVVIIDSRPSQVAPESSSTACHWYRPDASKTPIYLEFRNAPVWPSQKSTAGTRLPNRGELINYAVEHYARGSVLVFLEPGVHVPFEWDTAVFQCLEQPGVGMSSFAYRLVLRNKYMQRKHIGWAVRCHLANWLVNRQATRTATASAGIPTNWLLRHGAVRGAFYASLVTIARLLGTSQDELSGALDLSESRALGEDGSVNQNSRQHKRLPLIQPDYLDGY
ncbi:unnamed protein product [Dibothriocephalus latus]|uniref:Uncharacterized protein n=1 Tax=Dibothriocephalus latus TaxID=60516 RepID=A0A3P7KWX5_DIBLA|nr:unnamed protein product [Dibothriocephalus latus]